MENSARVESQASERLINKAIKRILLDIVIRGHGDRLIGRWSREPELQQFLEQVPYLLDRINQLHLACSRADPSQERLEHAHHHHHHAHHHHNHNHSHQHRHAHHRHAHLGLEQGGVAGQQQQQQQQQSSLVEVMGLIGEQRHWLVRTRDALGLTPLHKAVLANNWPVAEYLVDRYQEELAAPSWLPPSGLQRLRRAAGAGQQVSLIDAQDKYGRSALHYAAALLGSARDQDERRRNLSQLYHFLVARGASLQVRDFRGRTAAHYARHPSQLRAKSIVHLANKLNANYQANVLSKTLQAHAHLARGSEALEQLDCQQANSLEISSPTLNQALDCELAEQQQQHRQQFNRESMSVSSGDLRQLAHDERAEPPEAPEQLASAGSLFVRDEHLKRSRSSANLSGAHLEAAAGYLGDQVEGAALIRGQVSTGYLGPRPGADQVHRSLDCGELQVEPAAKTKQRLTRFASEASRQQRTSLAALEEPLKLNEASSSSNSGQQLEAAHKQLLADRCARLILDESTKLRVKSALSEGKVEKVSELLVEGLGDYLLSEAKVSCWNLQCKRYISQVIPELLARVDACHELIALNELARLEALLAQEPILARIRRPYRRASMNALHLAAQLDRRAALELLLRRFPELLGSLDSHGASCLHWAAKSLSQDRLYKWLLDNFGHQIEQLRDHRGKSAADYKLQAYKLFNFSSAHPNACGRPRGARHFLRRAQLESNELRLVGASCELSPRPPPGGATGGRKQPKAGQKSSRPKEQRKLEEGRKVESFESDQEEERTLDQSLELGLNSSAETPTKQQSDADDSLLLPEEHGRSPNKTSPPGEAGSPGRPHLAGANNEPPPPGRRASSASLNSAGARREDQPAFVARGRRLSEPNNAPLGLKPLNQQQQQLPKVSELELNVDHEGQQQQQQQQNQHQLQLINEMVQLDSNDLSAPQDQFTYCPSPGRGGQVENDHAKGNQPTGSGQRSPGTRQTRSKESNQEQEDSPLTTPSLPLPTCFASSSPPSSSETPESNSKRKQQQRNSKLDQLIASSITCQDYKKLEHLILAGCGQRILKVFAGQFQGKQSPEEQLPEELEQFLTVETPIYIYKIKEIHQVLHRCYANFGSQSGSGEQQASFDEAELHSQVNAAFHKLCNLLDRRRLIMCRDSFGAGPLHLAAMRSDARLIEYLLRRHPEAASAPDHDNRNVCHYAALAFKAFTHHGPLRLTNTPEPEEATQPSAVGFWLLDEQSRITYENLRFRYGELLEVRDRFGLSCEDYLSGPSSQGHLEGSLACCGDYLKLLDRYGYVPVFPAIETPGAQVAEAPAPGSKSNTNSSNERRLAAKRADSCELNEKVKRQTGGGGQKNCKTWTKAASSSPRSKTAPDESLVGRLLLPAAIDNPPFESGALSAAKQVAPKPTVGSDFGFPLLGQSGGAYRSAQDSLGPRTFSSLNGASSGRKSAEPKQPKQQQQLELEPAEFRSSGPSATPTHGSRGRGCPSGHAHARRKRSSQHKRRHHHHHHHHHHHRHHKRHQHKSAGEQQPLNSLVGGVIVPTIIHNDRMDEIETYDIIYRQPVSASASASARRSSSSSSRSSSVCSSSSSSSSPSSSASGSCHSSCSALSLRDSAEADAAAMEARRPRAEPRDSNEQLGEQSSESSSASSDLESSDEDERVERLSSEFESRVRREKSELRAKVDQIMNEIKLSAKSGKSARFLASPIDPAGRQKPAPGAGGGSSTVLFVDQRQTLAKAAAAANGQQPATKQQSLSSSGHSSARTSCSSASSLNSNGSSCASRSLTNSNSNSNTCSSSANSASSGTGSARNERNSPRSNASSTARCSSGKQPQEEAAAAAAAARAPGLSKTARQQDSSEHESELSKLAQQVISKNTFGQTYLHFIASRSQNSSTLYKVLEHARHLIGERDIFYRTARDVAVQFNLANNVQVLDKFVIDLFIAGNTTLLRYLLNQGYSPLIHVSDSDGNDIMLILKLLKLDRMIHYLLQMADFQRWRDELHTFIRNGYSAGVSELIRKHKDLVKARSVHARTSLHLAVLFDRPGMVRELVEADPASVHALDNMGRTALHYTYGLHLKNLEEIRDCLLANGASLNTRDVKMRTPKYYYIFKREIEDIRRIELELN